MKFKVVRTSDPFFYPGKPCENAYGETQEMRPPCGRQTTVKDWFVDINSLEELLAFQRSSGFEIIIESSDCPYPTIEIYDAYRE